MEAIGEYVESVGIVGLVVFGVGLFDSDAGWLGGVGIFGAVVGLFQRSVLRRQISRAGWWILASTVAWILGMPLGDMVGPPAMGAAYGAITGTVMVWMLRTQAESGAKGSPMRGASVA